MRCFLLFVIGLGTFGVVALSQTLGIFPSEEAFLFWQRGYLQHQLGDYQGAIRLYQKSLEAAPTAEAHTFLGWSLSMLARYEEAISECKKAIDLDPDYGNPYNDIGSYLIALGHDQEAVDWFHRAIKSKRYCCYEFPHFSLGRIHLKEGKWKDAKSSFTQALRHNPQYFPALEILHYLKQFEASHI